MIYAPATPEALTAKGATRTIPIVFSDVNDPVIVKLVESYNRPGGNVTGLAIKAAKALGIKVPQTLLVRATRIIE